MNDYAADGSHVFETIRERAVARKGVDHIETQGSALAPPAADDGRVLSAISKAVFYTGFSWKLVDRKWPGFEDAFDGFDVGWLNIRPDEFWDDRMRDPRIVRSPRRVASIRRNAAMVSELSSRYGGASAFFASWPDDDLIGLHSFVERQIDGLGWYGSQFVLRMIGRDTFVISPDLVAALKLAGVPIEGAGRSKKDRKVVQDTLLRWRDQTGRSLTYLSRVVSLSL
jgi:3-methyladenine DNA glycosylase Tag